MASPAALPRSIPVEINCHLSYVVKMEAGLIRTIILSGVTVFVVATVLDQAATVCVGSTSPILLTINDSNPSAVTVTATGLDAALDFSGNTANEGVDLLQFFGLDESGISLGQNLAGTLAGGNISVSYNDVNRDDYSTGGGAVYTDLELYVDINSPGQGDTETFSTNSSAFTGSWTIDLSSLGVDSSALPSAGSVGNILSGDNGTPGQEIGSWEVTTDVPEPSATSLLALGGLALGTFSYHRRTKSQR